MRLVRHTDLEYTFVDDQSDSRTTGSLEQLQEVFNYIADRYPETDFEAELDFAVSELVRNNHKTAHFGVIRGTFMFTE
jgi:hypothetical protein